MKKLKEQYEIVSLNGVECNIGLGAYGSVQLAKCLKTERTVAVKKVWNKLGITEVKFHQALNHENIIRLIDYFYDSQLSVMYIVLEYAENGCLYDFIKRNGIEDKQLIRSIFKSVCYGLDYMHQNGIMHRDVKPENILLGENNIVKLCDFGFATYCEPRKTICGTPEYMAPQMIVGKHYNHKVDVWGLGILLFQLIEGHAPFQGNCKQSILDQMKKQIYFSEKFTADEIQLIHNILRVNPNQRPQIKDILSQEWLGDTKNKKQVKSESSNKSTFEQESEHKNIKILNVRELSSEEHESYIILNNSSLSNAKRVSPKDQETMALPELPLSKIKSQRSYLAIEKSFLVSFRNGKISLKKKTVEAKLPLLLASSIE